jgi:integrase/recombinase XerC
MSQSAGDIILFDDQTSITISDGSIEQIIAKWLHDTASNSTKTRIAYELVMNYFREHLQARSLDVFSEVRKVAVVASEYVRTSYDRRGRVKSGKLSENTVNQRLAILSSFYTFCGIWNERIENPIAPKYCKREKPNVHDAAPHLEAGDVETALQAIPRETLIGKRDYALLLLALTTGRRAAELVALTWNDLRLTGKHMEVTWLHCKGNKTMKDILGAKTRDALEVYLSKLYGADLGSLANDAPIFVSLSRNNYGKAMSTQAVADLCKKYIGTSKIHTTRHTFAVTSEQAGASLSEIGERLGHSSLNTTSYYMQRRHSAENKHINKLESLYGL